MKPNLLTTLTLGSALSLGAFTLPAQADNPFSVSPLQTGYKLAQNDSTPAEGKCGEGKCGGKQEQKHECPEGKCGEGKCGGDARHKAECAEHKAGEGKCGEGKCGENKKPAEKSGEGKCGEGKCGNKG